MDKSVSLDMIKSFNKNCNSDSSLKMSRNAATHEITDLAMDWDEYRKIDHTFSEQISRRDENYEPKNYAIYFRVYLGRKHGLKTLSFHRHFMFWDKLEKSNYF